jgi:hypothetical protein
MSIINRIFWHLTAWAFMGLGALGAYLLGMLAFTTFIYERIYPLQWVNDRNGVVYPIMLIIVGAVAFLLYREYLRQEPETQEPFHRYYGD